MSLLSAASRWGWAFELYIQYSTQGRRRWRRRPQEEEEEEEVQCSATDQAEGGESLGEDSEIFAPSSNSVKSEGEKGEKLEKEGRGGGRKIRIWCIYEGGEGGDKRRREKPALL